jgi:hypothetical protein
MTSHNPLFMLLAVIATIAATSPTAADCHEGVGCTHNERLKESRLRPLNCGNLWFLRNAIYDDNGYCFKTEQGISAFGNDACRFANISDVPLNKFERYNVGLIQKVERSKGC